MSNKTSESQLNSIRKWEKDNVYKVTISFYKNRLPKEKYEEAKKIIKEKGISFNRFYEEKIKELLGDENEDKV